MIELNNTWCEATEENYNALIKFGIKDNYYSCFNDRIKNYSFAKTYIMVYDDEIDLLIDGNLDKNFKQIYIVNGEFQYVETKPKNNFKDYGFEADFEGEILKRVGDYYVGYVGRDYCTIIDSTKWDLEGNDVDMQEYHLKPIKKEWYENPDNFPCLVYHIYNNSFHIATDTTIDENSRLIRICDKYRSYDVFRPATKEEVLSLLIKDN